MIWPMPFRTMFLTITLTALPSCFNPVDSKPVTSGRGDQIVSFAAHIRPVFQSNGCLTCHGNKSNLNLESVAAIRRGGDAGPAVVAGDADNSNLIRKISATPPFGARMPNNGNPVNDRDSELLRKWIQQGAKDN